MDQLLIEKAISSKTGKPYLRLVYGGVIISYDTDLMCQISRLRKPELLELSEPLILAKSYERSN